MCSRFDLCNGHAVCVTNVPVPFRKFLRIPFLPFRSDEIGPVPRNCYPLPPVLDESDDAIDETDEIDETSPDVDPRRWDAISVPRSSLE